MLNCLLLWTYEVINGNPGTIWTKMDKNEVPGKFHIIARKGPGAQTAYTMARV